MRPRWRPVRRHRERQQFTACRVIGGGGSRGRLIVQLRVVVPTNLSNKQRELLRAFADEMGDDVASGKKSVTDRIKSALDDILD